MFYTKNLRTNNEIKHCFFSRNNGTSKGIYKSLNCGIGSKDSKDNIQNNLNLVSKEFNIKKSNLILMNQTHSNKVEVINKITNVARINCDAMLTKNNDIALCVLTADCVPILVFERNKKIIGCIHAGWKGAINGIIENFLKRIIEMGGNLKELVVSIGPCIAKQSYEVKKDFYLEFIKRSHHNESFFSNKSKSLNIFFKSLRKITIVANAVAKCNTIVINISSFLFSPSIASAISKWPLLLTGKNSVNP